MTILLTETQIQSPYYETLAGALEAAEKYVTINNCVFAHEDPFEAFATGGIPYGTQKKDIIEVLDSKGKGRYLTVIIYNRSELGRPVTKPYELLCYIDGSWKPN